MANRQRARRALLIAAAALLLAVLMGAGVIASMSFAAWEGARANASALPENRATALRLAREWARLAPYPVPESAIELTSEGSAFTRQFTLRFTAPRGDVKRWIAASPGLKEAKPVAEPGGALRYTIQPGGGAQFAELVLSADGTQVTIDTWWS